jgi:hypothetical protein
MTERSIERAGPVARSTFQSPDARPSPDPSDEYQRRSTWMPTRGQRRHRLARRDREQLRGNDLRGSDRLPIRGGIGDHEQDMIDVGIAHLECDPSDLRLCVDDSRFTFHRQPVPTRRSVNEAGDPGIPCASVARKGKWYLEPHRQAWMQAGPQSTEQSDLARIPQRVWSDIRLDSNVESDDRPDPGELPYVGGPDAATFDPGDLGRGYSDSLTDPRKRQPSARPSEPQLRADAKEIGGRDPSAPVNRSLSGGHRRSVLTRPYLPLNPVSSRTCLIARTS